MELIVGNSTLCRIGGLKDEASGSYITDATAVANIYDAAETLVGSATLDFVPQSRGIYQGTVNPTTPLVAGAPYSVVISATIPGGNTFRRAFEVVASQN